MEKAIFMKWIYVLLILSGFIIFGCAKNTQSKMEEKGMAKDALNGNVELKKMCEEKGWQWMMMKPTKDGKIIPDAKECMGCMVDGIEHVCDKQEFMDMMK